MLMKGSTLTAIESVSSRVLDNSRTIREGIASTAARNSPGPTEEALCSQHLILIRVTSINDGK